MCMCMHHLTPNRVPIPSPLPPVDPPGAARTPHPPSLWVGVCLSVLLLCGLLLANQDTHLGEKRERDAAAAALSALSGPRV